MTEYDGVERLHTVLSANFAADFTALATAKGVTDLPGPPTFVKRQKAQTFVALGVALPAIGIYVVRSWTQAKGQTQRDVRCAAVFDWYARHADPVLLAKQTDLVPAVLRLSIDRLAGGAGGVYGAAELEDSIVSEFTDGYDKTIEPNYDRRVTVTFPVYVRDTGL